MLNTILLFIGGISGLGIIFLLFLPLLLIIWAIVDLTKSNFKDDTSKIIWAIFIIFMPFLGAVAYLIFGRTQKIS
ncbi:PLDc N-terminal domain-containing protein [Marivirga sp.]|uniref:PLDc N-terminal domain-containing protein n=1 Tax=Marivirga sp. TaxID=2018662 RepID=UPI00345D4AD3